MKSIYNIYKSILDDIDIQMNKGDEIIKNFKKAEKDWKKLLSKTTGKSTGQFYVVSIKSPELAEYLASESSVFRYYKYEYEHKTGIKWPYDIDQVSIIYDIVHVFTSRDGMPRYVQINVDTKSITGRRVFTLVGSHIPFCQPYETLEDAIELDKGVGVKEAVGIMSRALAKKYTSIEKLKEDFIKFKKFEARI